tara:strand:+ start:1275 stop:1442 length:168 start_codon:yes stop_codon:yes gene_type:complete
MSSKSYMVPQNPLSANTGAVTIEQKAELAALLDEIRGERTQQRDKKTLTLNRVKE